MGEIGLETAILIDGDPGLNGCITFVDVTSYRLARAAFLLPNSRRSVIPFVLDLELSTFTL